MYWAISLSTGARPSFYLDVGAVTRFIAVGAGNDPAFRRVRPYLDAFTALVAGGAGGTSQVVVGLR